MNRIRLPLRIVTCSALLLAAFYWSPWLWNRAFMVVVLFHALDIGWAAVRVAKAYSKD